MYEHHIGDQRHRGFGSFMLEQIELDACTSGYKGVVAWAMDWEVWNPVSFYEHMGYIRADQEGKVVAVWKSFSEEANPPRLLRLDLPPLDSGEKVSVLVADNAWCDDCDKRSVTKEAIKGIEDLVEFTETRPPCWGRGLHLGNLGGIFLDGDPYRPYQVIGEPEDLRSEIIRRYEGKRARSR
jgi:hypothetical protein